MTLRYWLMLIAAAALGLAAGWWVQQAFVSGGRDAGGDPGSDGGASAAAPSANGDGEGRAAEIIGERRPDFQLTALDGSSLQPANYSGEVVVLNFWASWCPPCVDELPMLGDLQAEYGDAGVQVIGIAVEEPQAARDFAEDHDIGYPVAADRRGGFDIAADYGNSAGAIPYTVFIDRNGVVREAHFGELERDQAEAYLEAVDDQR